MKENEIPGSKIPAQSDRQTLIEKLLQRRLQSARQERNIQPRKNRETAPLSYAQKRIWFLQQMEPDGITFNRPTLLRLTGALDTAALESSLNGIINRHDILRTIFPLATGEPIQKACPPVHEVLHVEDLGGFPASSREDEALAMIRKIIRQPFNLETRPPVRMELFRLEPGSHLLLFLTHNIIFDGWSESLFLNELAAAYQGSQPGQPAFLPRPSIQYGDFAAWEQEGSREEKYEKSLAYWKERLQDIPLLELPADHPRLSVQGDQGGTVSLTIAEEMASRLKKTAQKENATLFTILLAAFYALLYRHTGQEDLAVGVPVTGRRQVQTETMIGMLLNTLVMRVEIEGSLQFDQFLARVRTAGLAAFEHEDLPFEKLIETLAPQRDLSRTPLFQAMFNLENVPRPNLAFGNLQVEKIEVDAGIAEFDLTLEIIPQENGALACIFEYSSDLFEKASVERMGRHYLNLLEGIAASPTCAIGLLPLMDEPEWQQVVKDWNSTKRDYPRDRCIHELFEEQVEKIPHGPALEFDGRVLSYLELNGRANRLAHYLMELGVRDGSVVGLLFERSMEMVVAMLATLKAGAAYLPLDPSSPAERQNVMLKDANVLLLLTQDALAGRTPAGPFRVISMEADQREIERQSPANPLTGISAADPAYIMFTSGSSGAPKGIRVPHRAVVRFVCCTDFNKMNPEERVALVSTYTFDASCHEIYGALLHGSCLVVMPWEVAVSPEKLAEQLLEQKISTVTMTPTLFNQVAGVTPAAFKGARFIYLGGEEVDPKRVREVQLCNPSARITNDYGPTEAAISTTFYEIPFLENADAPVPIGRPLDNTRVYILGKEMQPVPVGVAGELFIGGDGLAMDYLNNPRLTADKFLPDPFCDESGARIYRSGDRGRFLVDGNIEFLGRMDRQVKLRGYRIEPGEISSVLMDHKDVAGAVVLLREDLPGEKRLVAYVANKNKFPPGIADLRSFLSVRLPDYMIPSAFVFLERLPLTANGKLDERALPVPGQADHYLKENFIAPRTPVEGTLAERWATLLHLKQIGVEDNFFELGGHSLLATQVIVRIKEDFGVEIPLRSLFENPTIAALALVVTQKMAARLDEDDLLKLINELKNSSGSGPDVQNR